MAGSVRASDELIKKARSVRLAVFDVDGVLTDGGLFYGPDGEALKRFDVRDGLGLKLLLRSGIEIAVISARESAPLARRLADLGITRFFPGCSDKLATLRVLLGTLNVSLEEVAYAGDDLVDLPAMRAVGLPIAVPNAHPLVKQCALMTTRRAGGDGAAREIAEWLLEAQGRFAEFAAEYVAADDHARGIDETFSVVIPARFASTRLPGKPLRMLAGKPMVQHVYDNARSAGAGQVVVATDDERIERVVRGFGGEVLLTDPAHASGTDRIAEVATRLGFHRNAIVVNLQGDEPLIPPTLLKAVAGLLAGCPAAGIATLATPMTSSVDVFDPNVVKVVLNDVGLASYFSRAPIPWVREAFGFTPGAGVPPLPPGVGFLRHLGLYAYRVGTLLRLASAPSTELERAEKLEQLRALAMGIGIVVKVIEEAPGHGVDTPEDLERVVQELRGEGHG